MADMPKGSLFAGVVLFFSLLFYSVPFVFILFFSHALPKMPGEMVCWLFFIPAFLLPHFYKGKGVRLVYAFTLFALGMMGYLYATDRLLGSYLLRWLFPLLTAALIAFWVGILAENFSRFSAEAKAQNLQMKSLLKASELLAVSLNPQEVLPKSLAIIRESLGFEYADICLLEGENKLRLAADTISLSSDHCLPGLLLSSEEEVFIDEPLKDERAEGKNWFYKLGYYSSAALPLIYKGEKLGVLIVGSMKKYNFTPERRELLKTFANQLVLHIKNAMLYREMQQQAILDEVTGLYNYRYLNESLDKEIKRVDRDGGDISLLMLDLDYFKDYNDTYGHPAGDQLLREFGQVLKNAIRETDIAVRYGGDEFTVILPQTDILGAEQLLARILDRLSRHRFTGLKKMEGGALSVSIGSSTYPNPAKSKVELIKLADDQLYRMKEVRREARKSSS